MSGAKEQFSKADLEEMLDEIEQPDADAAEREQHGEDDSGDDELEFLITVRVAGRKLTLWEIGRRCVGCHLVLTPFYN